MVCSIHKHGFGCSLMALAGSLVLGAPTALAQTGEAAPDSAIVVTGSRLGSTGFSAPTPVTALGTDFIAARAPANIADVLNELPTFRDTSSPTQSQRTFGSGVNSIDLRGLGVVRTLVLVDGERFTPTAGTGVFDVGMIPAALVKRVDIITGGASAAYGSDAVAGVINFVLDTKMTGLRGGVQMGISQLGDNKQPSANLVFGTSFADGRGHFVAAGEWADSGGVGTLYSRDWGRQLPGLISYGTRAAGVPAQALATGVTYSAQTIGGLITTGPLAGTSFSPGGFQYGTVYGSLMTGGNNPLGQPFGNWPLATPVERKTGLTQISFEISPALEIYAQGNYGKTVSSNFTSFNQSNFTISVNNPYLPTETRQAMVSNGLSTISVGRLLAETGGLRQSNQRETVRGVFGAKAHLWGLDWDASFQHGETRSTNVIFQNVLTANYRAAVNAVRDANGNIVCGPVATNPNLTATQIPLVQSGCVPINIFGQGSPSAAALGYITNNSFTHTVFKRDLGAINLRGSPFSTWAGPVKIAIGAERRRDSIAVDVDDNSAQSLYGSGNNLGYRGSVVVTEEYAEIGVPLAKDVPLARSLDFNGAFRHTYYSTSGGVNTWKLGLVWEPSSDLRLRITRSHDIRAPNLSELYSRSGRGVSFANGINTINGRTGSINSSGVGNLGLVPEVAETLTAGVVLQPHGGFAQGLRLSVDAYSIKVKGVITTYNAQQVINNCAAGNAAACAQITFDNTAFGIYNVATMPQNLSVLETNGLDVELSYPIPLPIPGKLLMRVLGTHVFKLATTDNAGTVDRAGTLQGNGMPSDTINGTLTYTHNGFTGNLNARYVSGSRIDATLYSPLDAGYNAAASNSVNINRLPAALYFNLQVSHDIALAAGRKVNLFAGVDNLLDTAPPVFAATTINSGGNPYDLIGRRFTVGARFSL